MRLLVLALMLAGCGGTDDTCEPWSRGQVRGFRCSGSATPYLGQDDGGLSRWLGGYGWCAKALQQDLRDSVEWQCGS